MEKKHSCPQGDHVRGKGRKPKYKQRTIMYLPTKENQALGARKSSPNPM